MQKLRIDFPIALFNDLNPAYSDVLANRSKELIIYGGAGAGKSYFVAQYIIIYMLQFAGKKILVIRKTGPALKRTCVDLIENLLSDYRIKYEINRTELWIKCNQNRIIFLPVDNPEKIKSITDVDLIWIEEATELTEQEYNQVKLRLRGKAKKPPDYRQIILTFNPIDQNHWIKKRFFDNPSKDVAIFKFTYKDNKFLDPDYAKTLEDLKDIDINFYNIYCLGDWGSYRNLIYTNWEVRDFDLNLDRFDDVVGGLDFGYNNPSAYVLIGMKDQAAYLIDEVYVQKLTTSELASLVKAKNDGYNINPPIYCDTSEPDRIEELYNAGLNVHSANKDILKGISFIKTLKLYIHPNCVNTIKEIQSYKWKEDKYGNVLDTPVKFNDHAMDAMRYAIYSHLEYQAPILIPIGVREKSRWHL